MSQSTNFPDEPSSSEKRTAPLLDAKHPTLFQDLQYFSKDQSTCIRVRIPRIYQMTSYFGLLIAKHTLRGDIFERKRFPDSSFRGKNVKKTEVEFHFFPQKRRHRKNYLPRKLAKSYRIWFLMKYFPVVFFDHFVAYASSTISVWIILKKK